MERRNASAFKVRQLADDKKHEPFRREGGEQTKMIDEDTMQPNGNDEEEEKEESKDEESSE